jgi:glycosyltransferase involved in cell wall biosynthesis
MPKVSVIIPCYNQGAYLDEAVDSALGQTFSDLEVIIVNDGSTDELTIRKCASYNNNKIRLITTENQGLAAARNNGIAVARGEYILPLDGDDRIGPNYISEAAALLDSDPETGIVYCQGRLFGAVETDWLLPEFSIEEMLKDNIIFCSALFRKSDWDLAGGYDPGMVYGWEDYDLWLSLIERGRQVKQLAGRYFFYRVSADSMVRSTEKWQKIEMFRRIYQRHSDLIGQHIDTWLETLLDAREKYLTSRLYIDCGKGVQDQDSIARKVEPGTRVIVFTIDGLRNRQLLRFDPVDCPVCLEITSIELFDGKTQTGYDLMRLGSNALYRSQNCFRFDTDDPQIYLDLDPEALNSLARVTITLEFIDLGQEALKNIIEFQKTALVPERKLIPLLKWAFLQRS